jgi:hypothetical protein
MLCALACWQPVGTSERHASLVQALTFVLIALILAVVVWIFFSARKSGV